MVAAFFALSGLLILNNIGAAQADTVLQNSGQAQGQEIAQSLYDRERIFQGKHVTAVRHKLQMRRRHPRR